MTATLTRRCGFCDDCAGVAAMTSLAIRQRQRAAAERAAALPSGWDAWDSAEPAPVGIPVILTPEPST